MLPGYATAAALNTTHQSVLALRSELAVFKTHEAGEKASIRAEIAALGSTLAKAPRGPSTTRLLAAHRCRPAPARCCRDRLKLVDRVNLAAGAAGFAVFSGGRRW